MNKKNSIYTLKLHETIFINDDNPRTSMKITKVPGGWLYRDSVTGDTVYVPHSKEQNNNEPIEMD